MRILSQDTPMIDVFDIPYEMAMLSMSKYMEGRYRIYAQGTFIGNMHDDNFVLMAEYSTESRARKAMELLRHWKELRAIRNIPLSEDIATNSEFSKFIKKNFDVSVFCDECAKMDIEKTCEYFQFPSDDEVEV